MGMVAGGAGTARHGGGLCTFAYAGHVNWLVGIPLAIGGVVSVSSGLALAHHLPERRLYVSAWL
ncbi:hypothetical protein [Glaciimonas sp. PAMC28666]|uniref:hypothetical protein n=1 Tax=Glaciimonas sp. PAMC28666 TaxID=2807626 RepID=UPI001965AB38|nr:hypothetical protein [Glaciimonas sp. PAMC28666]QRX83362.1 hypothetical protein JQN73_03580 [Glaciimonas sp. PAMC28666]